MPALESPHTRQYNGDNSLLIMKIISSCSYILSFGKEAIMRYPWHDSLLESVFRITTIDPSHAHRRQAASELLDSERLEAFIIQAGEDLQSPTPAVTASIFVKRYLALIAGAFYSMSIHSYGLYIALDGLILTGRESWREPAFFLDKADGGIGFPQSSRVEWREAVIRHISNENLQPMINAFSRTTGISPNILWGHAAYLLHYYYDVWRKEASSPELRAQVEEDFRYLTEVEDPALFGSCEKNPFQVTYTTVPHPHLPGEQIRLRKHCCLAYMLTNGKCCYTCPTITEEKRSELLLAHMVRQ